VCVLGFVFVIANMMLAGLHFCPKILKSLSGLTIARWSCLG